jgi:flagellar biosynthesis/type III secretory pathway protein FliH
MQAYVDLLLYCLTKTDRERLVVMLQKSREPLSDVFKANFREGRKQGIERGIEQGIERGIEQGIERGIEQGRAETRREWAEAILQMLALRGIAVDSKSERRIRAGSSTALSEWSRRAAFVRDVGELFA